MSRYDWFVPICVLLIKFNCYYATNLKSQTKASQSKNQLVLGTWNVRGLRPKIEDVEKQLSQKCPNYYTTTTIMRLAIKQFLL